MYFYFLFLFFTGNVQFFIVAAIQLLYIIFKWAGSAQPNTLFSYISGFWELKFWKLLFCVQQNFQDIVLTSGRPNRINKNVEECMNLFII